MQNFSSWNRRDFISRVMGSLAASPLVGRTEFYVGQGGKATPTAPQEGAGTKPIYRTLGRTGISLPIVSMGVMNADVPGLIPRSYELGIRHFDTAARYQQGRNEEMVGRMIKQMGVRDQVIISTKVTHPAWGRQPGPETLAKTYNAADVKANFLNEFEGSLKRLQMDHVDILYNHAADSEEHVNAEGTLEAMTALKKEGKTRFLGVSSHQPEMVLREAVKLGVYDVVLIPINFPMSTAEGLQRMKDEAAKYGLKLTASYEGMVRAIDETAKKGIGLVAMKTQAGGAVRPDPTLGKPLTPASQTALLKWVLRHESITTAIPGYTTYEQLEQNFSVASNLAYTGEEQEFLCDKKTAGDAQFCVQCGQCRADCPLGVDIPQLMRSHMYAVQYGNYSLAEETLAAVARGKGLAACAGCESCRARCRNSVNIAMKVAHLKALNGSAMLRA